MKKKLAFIAILTGVVFFFLYSNYARDQDNISYTIIPELTEQTLSKEDLARVGEIHAECFEPARRIHLLSYYKEILYPGSSDYQIEYFKKKIEDDILTVRLKKGEAFLGAKNMVLMRYKTKIIGLYSCNFDEDFLEHETLLANVCITKNFRGKNLGKALVRHALNYCQKQGTSIYLTVYKDEPWNINLYSKLGFKQQPYPKENKASFSTYQKILMKHSEK